MSSIGLIAMAARPYHAGHDGLIRIAAKENNKVFVFASLSDRKRPGELPILGSDMEKIWREQIEPTLPKNVVVTYGGSPITNVYKVLGDANEAGNVTDTFKIYADPDDIAQNFPEKSLLKYAGNLFQNNQIILEPIQRTQTVNISGTKMREFLASGDKASFMANLPKTIDGEAVWNVLSANKQEVTPAKPAKKRAKTESLIRDFVVQYLKG